MSATDKNKKRPSGGDLNRARLFNRVIFGIALWGLLLTVHLWIQSERGFSHGCFGLSDPAEVGIVECAAVVQSDAGKLFGISNIVYGFFFFGAIAVLSFGTMLVGEKRSQQLKLIGFLSSAIGICYAIYLFSYQVFILGEFCKLCLATAFTTAVLFGTFLIYRSNKHTPTFDLAGLVREIGWFLLMALVAALLLVGDVFFVNRIGTLEEDAAQVSESLHENSAPSLSGSAILTAEDSAAVQSELAALCRFDDTVPPLTNFDQLIAGTASAGDPNAPVRIVEFFDPNCPHCKTLHGVMPEILAALGDRASVHYKPFPLWPYSFSQIEALYLADDEGKFTEMMDLQMRRQKRGGLSVSELVDIAASIGMDAGQFRRELNGGKYRSRVNRERSEANRSGIRSVPKVAIEGRFVSARSMIPSCMDYLVDQVVAG